MSEFVTFSRPPSGSRIPSVVNLHPVFKGSRFAPLCVPNGVLEPDDDFAAQ